MQTSHPGVLKLIYILGFARSGTTILGNVLGEVQAFLHVGELFRVWRRAVVLNDRCGCGEKVNACDLWSKAIADALSSQGEHSNFQQLSTAGVLERAWATQRRAAASTTWRDLVLPARTRNSALESYAGLMEALLRSVAQLANARVIVDSSKLISLGAYSKHMETIQPYFLHVIRDSRGAVFSRQRRVARREGERLLLNPVTTGADCYRWSRSNLHAGLLKRSSDPARHKVLRYEDFVANPESTLREIAIWVGEDASALPLVDDHTVRIGRNHTVCGNRNRFETGDIPLFLDDRWKKGLRTRDYLLITALTSPLLARYGYPVSRGARSPVSSNDRKPHA